MISLAAKPTSKAISPVFLFSIEFYLFLFNYRDFLKAFHSTVTPAYRFPGPPASSNQPAALSFMTTDYAIMKVLAAASPKAFERNVSDR